MFFMRKGRTCCQLGTQITDSRDLVDTGRERRTLGEMMADHSQTPEQRRHVYLALTQPILHAVEHHLQAYFEQLYCVRGGETSEAEEVSIPAHPHLRAGSQ